MGMPLAMSIAVAVQMSVPRLWHGTAMPKGTPIAMAMASAAARGMPMAEDMVLMCLSL